MFSGIIGVIERSRATGGGVGERIRELRFGGILNVSGYFYNNTINFLYNYGFSIIIGNFFIS
jgi:hypothetical protein